MLFNAEVSTEKKQASQPSSRQRFTKLGYLENRSSSSLPLMGLKSRLIARCKPFLLPASVGPVLKW